jgi:hypothetical protein
MSKILSDKLMRISGHKENSSTAWMIKVEKLPGTIVHPLQKQNGWVQKYLYIPVYLKQDKNHRSNGFRQHNKTTAESVL